jgi:hypothetical protein
MAAPGQPFLEVRAKMKVLIPVLNIVPIILVYLPIIIRLLIIINNNNYYNRNSNKWYSSSNSNNNNNKFKIMYTHLLQFWILVQMQIIIIIMSILKILKRIKIPLLIIMRITLKKIMRRIINCWIYSWNK